MPIPLKHKGRCFFCRRRHKFVIDGHYEVCIIHFREWMVGIGEFEEKWASEAVRKRYYFELVRSGFIQTKPRT